MKLLLSALMIFAAPAAFAGLPPGEYVSTCDGATVMQEFQAGSPVGEPTSMNNHYEGKVSIWREGTTLLRNQKMKVTLGEDMGGSEYEHTSKEEKISPTLVRVTDLTWGGSADYAIGADGSRKHVSSIGKDGKVNAPRAYSYSYVALGNIEYSVQLPLTEDRSLGDFTGWAPTSTSLFCVTKPAGK